MNLTAAVFAVRGIVRRRVARPHSLRSGSRGVFGSSAAVSIALLLLLSGCDNPACVFGGTCVNSGNGGSGGGVGTESASVPIDGEELLPAAPTLVKFFPTGTTADVKTPIVLEFSESMSTQNLNIAFELVRENLGTLPLQATALVGDGHMVVLFPLVDLALGQTYIIQYRDNVKVTDLTGQLVTQPTDRKIGSFTTAATNPTAPVVVATWPDDAAANRSPTGEIDVVFSRQIDTATVTNASFVVTADGVAPTNNPVPQPVTLSGVLTDTRCFRYRSLGPDGLPASLGTNANMRIELSPTGAAIKDTNAVALANKVFTFKTAPFSAPTGASITSMPADAIGIDEISGPADLAIQVDFVDAAAGDRLGVFIFGKEPPTVPPAVNPKTIALFREVPLVAPFASFTLTAGELDLLKSTGPVAGRVADGTINFAFYVKRGNAVSAVRMLDTDTTTKGTQAPVLDTVAPTLLGLGTSGNVANVFRSDMRDVVLVGRATETLRAALVTTALGDNTITLGELPPVTGSHSSGLFVTAPVRPLTGGVLDATNTPLAYTIEIYDRALNKSGVTSGQFTQVGQASSGAVGPFTNVSIEVVDAVTLAPVVGASVSVHENFRGTVSGVDSGLTDSTGHVTLSPALLGETIVTVDALGYDLFTFDGLPTDHVSIPLSPTNSSLAAAAGALTTTDPNVSLYTRSIADSRVPSPGETLATIGTCNFSSSSQSFQCAFGPVAITSRQIGAESAIVVVPPANPFLYSPLTFLKAYVLQLPLPAVAPGATQTNALAITQLLDAGTLDPEERPIDVPPHVLSTVNYPMIAGDPRVRVEGNSPGLKGTVSVGEGIAFDDALPPNTFAVRAAYPGSVDGIQDVGSDALGRFVKSGTIEPDLLLRAEVVDSAGNRGGARPRLSLATTTMLPPAPPALDTVPLAQNGGGVALDLAFADVIADSTSEQGIYRATVTDSSGRSWTIWGLDQPDASGPLGVLHLPKVGAGGTVPLATGTWSVRMSAFAWTTFDATSFLWSDIEREYDLFSHATAVDVTSLP